MDFFFLREIALIFYFFPHYFYSYTNISCSEVLCSFIDLKSSLFISSYFRNFHLQQHLPLDLDFVPLRFLFIHMIVTLLMTVFLYYFMPVALTFSFKAFLAMLACLPFQMSFVINLSCLRISKKSDGIFSCLAYYDSTYCLSLHLYLLPLLHHSLYNICNRKAHIQYKRVQLMQKI